MPAFIVGVTGSMKINAGDEGFQAQVGMIFDWLRAEKGEMAAHAVLGSPLGLKNTPIVVLSSLAPGADQLVAGVARTRGWRVLAPLPFPSDLYRDASTFRQGNPEEDAQRQIQFDAILAHVGEENCFPVLLLADVSRGNEERRAVWQRDRENRPARNLRYRAAGEYVAAYCDLLISLSDHGHQGTKPSPPAAPTGREPERVIESGAKAIIEAKRRGVTPDLLPVMPAVNWADNGPIVNVFARDGDAAYDAKAPRDGAITLLHPYDCRPAGDPQAPDHDEQWQSAGTRILRGIAANLERLNRERSRTSQSSEDAAYPKMFGAAGPSGGTRPPSLDGPLLARLETMARARRRVADQNGHYGRLVGWCFAGFICLAFLTLLSLQLYENWPLEGWRLAALVAAMAWTIFAWVVFRGFRKSSLDDRQNDYRAVAEGLRVQFYWTAAGTGESAASDYLQRQRSELSWVRGAVSSVSFPYEPARDWFENLSIESKLDIFMAIRKGWTREQLEYFRERAADVAVRRHSLHFLRNTLLTIGLSLLISQAVMELSHHEDFAREHAMSLLRLGVFGLLPIVGLWLFEWIWDALRKRSRPAPAKLGRRPPPLHFWQVVQPFFWGAGPAGQEEGPGIIADRLSAGLAVVVGLLLASLLTGAVFLAPGLGGGVPDPLHWLSILKTLCLGAGGLVHLCITLKFLSENLRRYDAMSSLFQAADVRMEKHLEDLTLQVRGKPAEDGASATAPDPVAAAQTIRHLQSLCLALGREALAENAEWLLMHRDRRIRPVMPG